ncbi:hypothetical protein M7I_2236 [Glarea lozoyensis 74030]|uniref:Uncharacterized protein n=1 Tax=Glarea lozoyensis (strain ATCC 74030 / MF5533) TaxID=1104152 RepID=H0EI86_GLAL7|nr:hypothetical protein M7I_2236 [Glarea lozoyensis 74030]
MANGIRIKVSYTKGKVSVQITLPLLPDLKRKGNKTRITIYHSAPAA